MNAITKSARIQLRVSSRAKEQIAAAAAISQQDVTSFILDAATARARSVLLEDRVLLLSDEELDTIEQALDEDPTPSPTLVKLFREARNDPRVDWGEGAWDMFDNAPEESDD